MWLAALRARILSDADGQSHSWFFLRLVLFNKINSRYIISSSKGIVKTFTAFPATHVVAARNT
jgi:hypothetical protein